MATCQGKTKDGRPCSRKVKEGAQYCWQHKSGESEIWREVYERLETATPEEKTDIVLRLIEEHPEKRLELPERDGVKANLRAVDLSRDSLKARLALLSLESAPWWDADLQGAHLRYANLQGADLRDTKLQGADLIGADLQGADLIGADLRGAYLIGADLQGAYLTGADLQGAFLRYAKLQGAFLRYAKLQGAFLREAYFQDAFLREADLQGAFLVSTNLQGAVLREANLQDADLRDANLQGAYLIGAKLQGANLSGANLQGTRLWHTDLQGANLARAKLQGVDLSNATIIHIHISEAWLDRTRLRWEQLGGAIGEELASKYGEAKQGYLALKQNFEDLGDYDAASKAYRKERRMEKLETLQKARTARSERRRREAAANHAKFASDQFVEWICDYGESAPRVLGSLVVVYVLFTLIYGLTWSVMRVYDTPTALIKEPTHNLIDLARFSLGAMTTMSPAGLESRNGLVELLAELQALLGIALVGLLGFVLGNRIRRS